MFAVALLIVVWYSGTSLRSKIFVNYTRVDGTEEEFLVRIDSRYLIFDHKRFKIIRKCIRFMWYRRGVHSIFPVRVAKLHYVWNNEMPIDPDTGQIFITSPTASFYDDQEQSFVAYNRANQKTSGRKESFLQRHGAIIAIVLVVIVAAFFYMKFQGVDASITALANYYKTLAAGK